MDTEYRITFLLSDDHDPSLQEYQEDAYTLEEAIDMAQRCAVDIKLTDESDTYRGRVHSDGTYTLEGVCT